MPIATTPLPQSTSTSTLPPPQTFDILPPLHALLSRLLLPRDPVDPSSPSAEAITPISPKELGAAASAITNKIQRAGVAARELPGIEMSLRQQEGVIRELEEEVRRLEGVGEVIRGKAKECVERHPGVGDGDAMEVS